MLRPPRDPRGGVITGRMWSDIVLVGLVMAAGTLGVMDWALPGGLVTGPEPRSLREAQTLAFTTLVFYSVFQAFNARFEDRSAFHKLLANRWLLLAIAVSAALQVAVVYVPLLQRAFHTAPLAPSDWLLCVAVASSVLWAMELWKLVVRSPARTGRAR
jgi:Ca2+-transporting ATPase